MPETGETGSEYRILRAVLDEDLRKLHDTQSIKARDPMKKEMEVKFHAWVDGAIEAGKTGAAAQDEIVVTMMIWAIDYRDIDRALDIGEHAIRHGLILPERYNRTAACFIAEEIAVVAMKEPESVTAAQLTRAAALTDEKDMPDQARAKLRRAQGQAALRAADTFDPSADNAIAGGKPALLQAAADFFKAAIGLHDRCGAKLELKAAETGLAQLAPPPA
jgi:hypothetical protein